MVNAPRLLREIELGVEDEDEEGEDADLMPRFRSLAAWLARRAAGHVETLTLHLRAPNVPGTQSRAPRC